MDGKTNKMCISLPDETMAVLDYLVKAWRMPPTAKRSQVIQQAIWQAYLATIGDVVKKPMISSDCDDYII